MGLTVVKYEPYAVIDGVEYYRIGDVSKIIGKSSQTIKLWEKWSDELELNGSSRLIPASTRIGKNKIRCWTEEEIYQIKKFSESVKYGQLAKFSRTRWGVRAQNLKRDNSIEARKERERYRKEVNRKAKLLDRQRKVEEMKAARIELRKSLRRRAKMLYDDIQNDIM